MQFETKLKQKSNFQVSTYMDWNSRGKVNKPASFGISDQNKR